MAVARTIVGPQDQFERSGALSLRDIRPMTTRLSEELRSSASGLVLAVAAGGTWFEPAVIDLTVSVSAFYALWVLTRRPKPLMRLPKSAACPDESDPEPGRRRAKRADGTIFIGWSIDGRELWVTAKDARQHFTFPGTTGAGKTSAILSLLVNALCQGSGFVLVDGKGDRYLFGKVLALARRFGREDDVRALNFIVASGDKDSHSFQPFAVGNADALRELLVSQLGEPRQDDANGVFRDRAVALIGTITPVLVWLRDHKGTILNIETIRFSIELGWIWKLAIEKVALLRDPRTGTLTELDLEGEIPEDLTWPLRAYLGELPGYDPSLPLDRQRGDEPSKQHGYARFYFTNAFTQLAVSLGHIFRVECGDVDMRDIVLNRRILVVTLPALENSDLTLAALGKLVVASLRAMMAPLVGGSLEGGYTEADKPGMGPSPYFIVLDELAYYATSGMDRMLAMGRGLGMSFMLGFQEISGIWARLGEKTASLLGNATINIVMRQQDGGRTRQWIEKTAGETYVTQATSFLGAEDGAYREARQAEVRPVSRVDWKDLTSQIEGEATVLWSDRRIYGRVFHAEIDDTGIKRLGRTVMLAAPDGEQVRRRLQRLAAIGATIERGALISAEGDDVGEDPSPVIDALRDGFIAAAKANAARRECAQAALAAVAALPESALPPRPPPPADGSPVTAVTPMLRAAAQGPIPGPPGTGGSGDVALVRSLVEIERAAGAGLVAARVAARLAVSDRDAALGQIPRVEPPTVSADAYCGQLRAVLGRLRALRSSGLPRAA